MAWQTFDKYGNRKSSLVLRVDCSDKNGPDIWRLDISHRLNSDQGCLSLRKGMDQLLPLSSNGQYSWEDWPCNQLNDNPCDIVPLNCSLREKNARIDIHCHLLEYLWQCIWVPIGNQEATPSLSLYIYIYEYLWQCIWVLIGNQEATPLSLSIYIYIYIYEYLWQCIWVPIGNQEATPSLSLSIYISMNIYDSVYEYRLVTRKPLPLYLYLSMSLSLYIYI